MNDCGPASCDVGSLCAVFEAMCVAPDTVFATCRGNAPVPTSFLRHVGKHLYPAIVFGPCRGTFPVPTSFLRHVGVMPLSRHRFCAMSGKRLCPDIVFAPCRFSRAMVAKRRHERP